ncbi:MAG: chemotaxis response regulator protein-glutamate methylesterase [Euryarchaeota archaeon]|nr:chemotaxis response regulator protein-glutamate methylesterase [Euryarchaeota archaeon]
MIRTLVVDDSKFMRTLISDMLVSDSHIDVIATAKDGTDAVAQARLHHPDVITLDVEMPRMDGLEALKAIMKENPTPVVMLSALTQEGADATLEALHHGAVDFVPKPSGSLSLDIDKVKDLLISKIKAASLAKPERHLAPRLHRARASFRRVTGKHVIAIGTSTGGPRALSELLPQFPGDIPAGILIVQHMPPWFTKSLAERLDRSCAIRVKEAEVGDKIEDGQALIAPGDYHMVVKRAENGERVVDLNQDPPVHAVRPAADIMLQSVAASYGSRTLGVILTGMGSDGACGMEAIKEHGGKTIVSDEETSLIFGMPKAAIDLGCVDRIAPLHKIPEEIGSMLG